MVKQQQKKQTQKQKSSSSTHVENILLIILASLSLLIALFLIFYMVFKYSCKNTFIQKFPDYGECIYKALNENLSSSRMNQICNSILNCNYTDYNTQLNCLGQYLKDMLQGDQQTLINIISSLKNECQIVLPPLPKPPQ